jgi:chorismate lyase/3-hydroxybenzoate synthase
VRPFRDSDASGAAAPEDAPGLPGWCGSFAGLRPVRFEAGGISVQPGDEGAVLSTVIADAASLSAGDFEAAVGAAYGRLAGALAPGGGVMGAAGLWPVRFWNFIPGIHDPCTSALVDGSTSTLSRYMVFNAGRFDAIERWRAAWAAAGSPLGGGIGAATGVGYRGSDVVVHCLAVKRPGRAVENPRQVPAYRYSRLYGPLPPCFARGTVLETPGGAVLLIGGTASVRGEESVHQSSAGTSVDCLVAQVEETLKNLASLIETGLGGDAALRRLHDARVYFTDPGDRPVLESLLRGAFAPDARVEFIRADICRPELRVEIEGVAGARRRSA